VPPGGCAPGRRSATPRVVPAFHDVAAHRLATDVAITTLCQCGIITD
jgi:hypothetical protein